MKRLAIICILVVGLFSCKGQEQKQTSYVDVTVSEFQKMLAKGNAQLVDVRTPREYNEGHLKGALLIDFMGANFKENAVKGLDKTKPVLVYCAAGGRSAKSAIIYKDAGFKKVYNLVGGFRAWKANKLDIEK